MKCVCRTKMQKTQGKKKLNALIHLSKDVIIYRKA